MCIYIYIYVVYIEYIYAIYFILICYAHLHPEKDSQTSDYAPQSGEISGIRGDFKLAVCRILNVYVICKSSSITITSN